MSESLERTCQTVVQLSKNPPDGKTWSDEAIGGYIIRLGNRCFSQGDFKPRYEGKDSNSEPQISYHFDGIKLDESRKEEIRELVEPLGFMFEYKRKRGIAEITSPKWRGRGKRKVMTIDEKDEKITVNSPKTVPESGKLLEIIGSVFGMEA